MEQLLDECIVACENCFTGCLEMNNTYCVCECIVCERICKTLQVAIKCNMKPNLLKSLKKSCELACKDCIKVCKPQKLPWCVTCADKCGALVESLSNSKKSKKSK